MLLPALDFYGLARRVDNLLGLLKNRAQLLLARGALLWDTQLSSSRISLESCSTSSVRCAGYKSRHPRTLLEPPDDDELENEILKGFCYDLRPDC